MITALDHIAIAASDPVSGATQLEALLARKVSGNRVQLSNLAIALITAPDGEGLAGLAFATDNIDAAFKVCERRALKPELPNQDRQVSLSTDATFGVPISLVEHAPSVPAATLAGGAVTGLDHVVIRTTHPNRAVALYGARLGLDLRLDRTEQRWGTRFMFFRCGDLIIEVVYNLKDEPSDAPDHLWGVTWRVDDLEAAHARLASASFDISEMRTGRKPGTRVFTVRNKTLGVPTLMLQQAPA